MADRLHTSDLSQEKDKVIDHVEGTMLDEHYNGKPNPIAVEVFPDPLTPASTAHAPSLARAAATVPWAAGDKRG